MRALMLLALALSLSAQAGDWEPTADSLDGVYRLDHTRVKAVVTQRGPSGADIPFLVCIDVGDKGSVPGCPNSDHSNRRMHVWLGTPGDPTSDDMMDSAKLALAQGRKVVLQIDSGQISKNRNGVNRCLVTRLVVKER